MDRTEGQPFASLREGYQEPYEQMVRALYDYQSGTISFLELLTKWEQLLQIPSSVSFLPDKDNATVYRLPSSRADPEPTGPSQAESCG